MFVVERVEVIDEHGINGLGRAITQCGRRRVNIYNRRKHLCDSGCGSSPAHGLEEETSGDLPRARFFVMAREGLFAARADEFGWRRTEEVEEVH